MSKVRSLCVFCVMFFALRTLVNAEWVQKRGLGLAKNMLEMNGSLFCGNAANIQRSSDFGESWVELISELPDDGHLRDYFVTDGTYLYNLFYGFTYDALYRSADRGATWTLILKKETKTMGRVFGLNGRVIVENEGNDGYSISTDGGVTWAFIKGCLVDGKNVPTNFISMVEFDGRIFVSRSMEGFIIVSDDGLRTFRTVKGPQGNAMLLRQAGKYLITGVNEYGYNKHSFRIYTSADAGKTWADVKMNSLSTNDRVTSAVESKGILYITLDGKIYSSTDSGKTWQDISENLMQFEIGSESCLAVRDKMLGLQGSVHFWLRKIN